MSDFFDRLDALAAEASPGPWFLDSFDLHDAGTWLIGVMARKGNPSTKSDPVATGRLAALAPHLPRLARVAQLVIDDKRPWHDPPCGSAACLGCLARQALRDLEEAPLDAVLG